MTSDPGSSHGPNCPTCGHDKSQVMDSRPNALGQGKRRRKCPKCNTKFTTIEEHEAVFVRARAFHREVRQLKGRVHVMLEELEKLS